jgi:hypothetical protein
MDRLFIIGVGCDDEKKKLDEALASNGTVKEVHAGAGGSHWLVHVEIEDEPDDDDD